MEIVIKIDDEQYNIIHEKMTSIREEIRKNGYAKNDIVPLGWQAIADGIQLPKGHGDLIDKDQFERLLRTYGLDYEADTFIPMATTVIEGDTDDMGEL